MQKFDLGDTITFNPIYIVRDAWGTTARRSMNEHTAEVVEVTTYRGMVTHYTVRFIGPAPSDLATVYLPCEI